VSADALRQLVTLAAAAAVAAALLVLFVLPAEYGIDPLGTGEALGLTGLAEPPAEVVHEQEAPLVRDAFELVLEPWESAEVKYAVLDGGGLVWTWQAGAPVRFEFHGEPAGGPEGFAETFRSGEEAFGSGTAVLPFPGRHGWFFENRSVRTVTVTLEVAGFFSHRLVYRDGHIDETPLAAPLTATR
jgi:hypothetical protein